MLKELKKRFSEIRKHILEELVKFLECSFKFRQLSVHSKENFMEVSALKEPCGGGYGNKRSRW